MRSLVYVNYFNECQLIQDCLQKFFSSSYVVIITFTFKRLFRYYTVIIKQHHTFVIIINKL